MSIFGKSSSESQGAPDPQEKASKRNDRRRSESRQRSSTRSRDRSYLGPGCTFDGEIRGHGSLECRGTVEGTVDLDGDIVIGEGGTVRAQLSARRIHVGGRLEGDALGREKVEVGEHGQMQGDVRAPSVAFAEGAFFEGNVEMKAVEGSDGDDGSATEEGSGGPDDGPDREDASSNDDAGESGGG